VAGVVVAIGTGEAFPLLGAAVGTGFADPIGTGVAFPVLGATVGTGFAAVGAGFAAVGAGFAAVGEAEADGTALAGVVVPAVVARAVGVAGALADCDAPDDA
jgi:hypothetical protein